MLFSKNLPAVCMLFVWGSTGPAVAATGEVSDVGSGRIGVNVVRYVKKFNSSCLEVQVVSPDSNWRILSDSDFCTFQGKSLDSDFADASFKNISIRSDGLHMTLSVTPIQLTGEERRTCHIPIEGVIIKELNCSDESN